MTAVNPPFPALNPPDQADHLGSALQQGLPRPMNPKLYWGLIRTFIFNGLTGGILPVICLTKRFFNFASAEQMQFWHLSEWLRLQTGAAEATATSESARRVMPGKVMRFFAMVFTVAAIGIGWSGARYQQGHWMQQWFALTMPLLDQRSIPQPVVTRYQITPEEKWRQIYHPDWQTVAVRRSPHLVWNAGNPTPAEPTDLVKAFTLAMIGAGICWLIQINMHINKARRFVTSFNKLSNRYGVGEVRLPNNTLGLRPLWILGASAMCCVGAFWSVPVLLAASAQRRYIRHTSLRLRSDLARRQREVLLRQRPAVAVPTSAYLMDHCPQPNCRAALPPEAVFCKRCGSKVNAERVKG